MKKTRIGANDPDCACFVPPVLQVSGFTYFPGFTGFTGFVGFLYFLCFLYFPSFISPLLLIWRGSSQIHKNMSISKRKQRLEVKKHRQEKQFFRTLAIITIILLVIFFIIFMT